MLKYLPLLLFSFCTLTGARSGGPVTMVTPTGESSDRLVNPDAHTTIAYRHFIDKGITDRTGACWFMSTEGVYRYAGGRFTLYRTIGGLYMGYGGSILEDRRGNIWFGALGGIVRYDLAASTAAGKATFATYYIPGTGGAQLLASLQDLREAPGSPAMVRLMLEDRGGEMWFATGHQLYRTDSTSGTVLPTAIGAYLRADRQQYRCTAPDDYGIYGLYQDRDGHILISMNACSCGPPATYLLKADRRSYACVLGQCGHDLLRSDHYQAHTREIAASLSSVTTRDGNTRIAFATVLADRSGRVWIGSDSGVYTYEGGYFTRVALGDTLNSCRITAMSQDATGAMWFGTGEDLHFRGHGVWRYQPAAGSAGGGLSHYTTAGGMPAQTPFRNDIISSLLPDRNGRMWIAGQGGICYFAKGAFGGPAAKDVKNELPVYFAMQDKAGDVWFSTWELGLYRYHAGGLERLSEK